ncbi:MAG TPA: HNH endonuclease signature motif containing protein [Candidatus Cloacimonadota bacterium]|nr:HNH endonuclease signature motif containing protein [Candidatus Cloacimonadota bacterium]
MEIDREKFDDCLSKYVVHCEDTNWVDGESYKFRFANWLNHKVNLKTQTVSKIHELCMQSMKEYYDPTDRGIQFIIQGARKQLSRPILISDAEVFKTLAEKDDPILLATYDRGMSFPILTAWLGTLLPKKYVSASTTDFVYPIEFLFNTSIVKKSGFEFFIQSQEYFMAIKAELMESSLKPYFLPNINKYLNELYPNSPEKKKYDEVDWNWVTEDFALYIHREYLKLYVPKVKKAATLSKKSETNEVSTEDQGIIQVDPDEPFDETPEIKPFDSSLSIEIANHEHVDVLADIIAIDNRYRNAAPEVKEVISKRIERGAFSNKFRQAAGYKCMICERMGLNPHAFRKPNGDYYVEVHHVIPVSELIEGSLSSANLITVCANHHRQLHFGNCHVEEIDDKKFIFRIDNKPWHIQKLGISILKNGDG